MDRRQFVLTSSAFLGAGVTAAATIKPATKATGPGTAADLYRKAVVLDCNLGPDLSGKLPLPAEEIAIYRSSGVTIMKTTMGGFNSSFEDTVDEIAFYQQVIETHPDVFMQVRSASDFARAKRENQLGIIFSFEGVGMLDGKVEHIEIFRHLGVRVMQLSYNDVSPFGSGVLAPPDAHGLTDLGRTAVEKMNELGVAVDLSHASPTTTREAMAHSKVSVIMSHGGCAAVHPHPRNKTDEQLRALAQKGGVLGIYDLPYLTASPHQPNVADYIDHMAHALSVCGEDHVGIGSDQSIEPFDTSPKGMKEFQDVEDKRHAAGVAAPEEDRPLYVEGLNVPNRCEVIADSLLKRGYPASVTEKVLGANFVRVFTEIWS
jgi:membrane dipeptidase